MVENKKEKLKAIVSRSAEELEITLHNNQLKRTISKNTSVKEDYFFIVPWQMH